VATRSAVRTAWDAAAWDQIVLQHPQGSLFQRWGWGELKQRHGSWLPVRMTVTDGTRIAAAQLLLKHFYGVAVAYVPRGPLFSGDATLDRTLLDTVRSTAKRHRAGFLRLEPNLLETDSAATSQVLLPAQRFRLAEPLQPHSTIHLDLTPPVDQLFAACARSHRAHVRRAQRRGVAVRVGTSAADLATFYRMMTAVSQRQQFAIHARDYYATAWQLFAAHGDACLLIAELDGEAIGAFLVFRSGLDAYYLYSGTTAAGLKHEANYLLQWQAIAWAKAQGCARYDLWGIPDAYGQLLQAPPSEQAQLQQQAAAHPLAGVYGFKQGWGGQVVRYVPAYDQVYVAPMYWLWQRRRQAA